MERDSAEFGKYPVITSFENNSVSVRKGDGSLVTTGVSPYPAILHGYVTSQHWDDATKLCRFVKVKRRTFHTICQCHHDYITFQDSVLWACLAGMAVHAKHLDTAEVAYAAIQEADKVYYIQYIKELPLKEARAAEMSVMTGNYQDAENMLLQSGLVFRAIVLNIYLHQWEKALDLAIKNKTHVDTVLAYRLKYLARCDKEENNTKYTQYMKEVEVDWDKINEKIEEEHKRERELKSSPVKAKKPARH